MPPNGGMKFDVIIYDSIGMEYTEESAETGALGGSELEVTILAEELSRRGKSVLVENRHQQPNDQICPSGAIYRKLGSETPLQTKTLVVMRYSKPPRHIVADKTVVWLHDIPSHDGRGNLVGEHQHLQGVDATFVCVSRWQAELFPKTFNKHVIPNMLPAWNYDLQPQVRIPGRFHYASGAMKGLNKTIALWRNFREKMKSRGLRQHPELHVFTPAWSPVEASGEVESGVIFHGPVSPTHAFLSELSKSEGMFYVNELPENFCISAAQTELFGGRVHVLCVNGEGGIRDTLSHPEWITTDPGQFEEGFFAALRKNPKVTGLRFHPETVLRYWLDVLS